MHPYILLVHILAATVWVGGHLILALAVLPQALRARSPEPIQRFERTYEPLGIGALLVQILTGVELARQWLPDAAQWIAPESAVGRAILAKFVLLALTALIAVHARKRIITRLSEQTLRMMAVHILLVTALAVLFVVVGVSFRTGIIF